MAFKFEDLRVWKEAMNLGEAGNAVAVKFPKLEMFNLTSQIMRAVDSIALNVAEGSAGQSNAENAKFIGYAIRSSCEVITCLHKAILRKYIKQDEFEMLYNQTEILFKMLNKYRTALH
jgi:four helix bundle protein